MANWPLSGATVVVMRHKNALCSFGWTLVLAGTVACGADGDLRPLPGTGPTPTPSSLRLVVTDGWNGAPVPQARVTQGAQTVMTDAAGRVEVDASPCVRTTVVASGFLERSLRCLPAAASHGSAEVTLWPVANDAERTALQTFAFRGRGETLVQPYELILEISPDLTNVDTVSAAWQRAGQTLAEATRRAAGVRLEPLQEDGAIVSPWSSQADCAASIYVFEWQPEVAGFCPGKGIGYFAHVLHAAPSRIDDDRVALRAMLYELGLRPHALQGLMHATQPADTLSDFERRTLHMMSLRTRRYPHGVSWPDTEF